MGNRAKVEQFILKYIEKLSPNSNNKKLYIDLFKSMTDDDFKKFIDDLESGERFLCLIEPNGMNTGLSVENNLKIAEELGHDFFQQIWIDGKENEPSYLTPIPYLVLDLPLRRASQLLIKKIKVPDNNKSIDILSGQPTGSSKGAKISYPEAQVCAAVGLENSLIELMKYRGGDLRGNRAYTNMINKLGRTNLDQLQQYSSGVESTKTLKTFLNSMMLKTNI